MRASPKTARAASRFKSRASIGASVATTIMHDPSPVAGAVGFRIRRAAAQNANRPSSFPTGAPFIVNTPP